MRAWLGLAVICFGFSMAAAPAAIAQARNPRAARNGGAMAGGGHAATSSNGAKRSATAPAKLPLRRIVLYKDGVGYFEHLGRVRGDENVSIDFTTAQLNDVLNSLTILDLDGGRITSVDYNSEASLGRRISKLRLPVSRNASVGQFLRALVGARLEVRSPGATITGRLLSVQTVRRKQGNTVVPVEEISLVSDRGEVRMADLGPATSVRILGRGLRSDVGRYLALRASARRQSVRRMVISTAGTGPRQLYVSYISEVPVWKVTYRIVLPAKSGDKPLLQGWAIVDNTVGEDWNNVRLSLMAGAPQSFIENLSQPYYARRPVVPLPRGVQLMPQTHEPALKNGLRSQVSQAAQVELPHAGVMGGVAGGAPRGSAGVGPGPSVASAAPPPFALGGTRAENALNRARIAAATRAEGRALGALFEYNVKKPVTIRKGQSALVPILQTPVGAEKVSLWKASLGSSHPLRAIWLTNSSALTLAGGSFSVLEGETFAGEGLLDSIKPGEKRLLSYAVDLGMQVDAVKGFRVPAPITEVRISHGTLIETRLVRRTETYTVRNDNSSPRTLIIDYPRVAGWKLDSGEKPVETTVSNYRFQIHVQPKKTTKLQVSESRRVGTRYALTNLTDERVAFFLRQGTINARIAQALEKILAQKKDVAVFNSEIGQRRKQVAGIFQDQQRIRKDLDALKGDREAKTLTERYTERLNDQETQLATLRKEISALQAKRQQAQHQLDRMIEQLDINEKI
jgi:hypothetical protein